MIEVEVRYPNGDVDAAEAETPEAAVAAARALATEAFRACGVQGWDPAVAFRVDGAVVRTTTWRGLLR